VETQTKHKQESWELKKTFLSGISLKHIALLKLAFLTLINVKQNNANLR
jgi:hypothetical protein